MSEWQHKLGTCWPNEYNWVDDFRALADIEEPFSPLDVGKVYGLARAYDAALTACELAYKALQGLPSDDFVAHASSDLRLALLEGGRLPRDADD